MRLLYACIALFLVALLVGVPVCLELKGMTLEQTEQVTQLLKFATGPILIVLAVVVLTSILGYCIVSRKKS